LGTRTGTISISANRAVAGEERKQLHQAVIELDTAQTLALIDQVTKHDASFGRVLNELARRLVYRRLLKLLESEKQA
jgi:hypothetical protein